MAQFLEVLYFFYDVNDLTQVSKGTFDTSIIILHENENVKINSYIVS